MADLGAAIERIELSRSTHVAWIEHFQACAYCQQYPPAYVNGIDEQRKIVAEYDNVLTVLRSQSTTTKGNADEN